MDWRCFTLFLCAGQLSANSPELCSQEVLGRPVWTNWFMNATDSRKHLIEAARMSMARSQNWADEFQDALALHWLRTFRHERVLMAFLAGNSETDIPPDLAPAYRQFISEVVANGYTILYDADARTAPIIRDVAPGACVGVSAKFRDTDPLRFVLRIGNPFLRLKFFELAKKVVVSPRSSSGLGLLLDGRAGYVLDPGQKFKFPQKRKDTDQTRRARWGAHIPILREFPKELALSSSPPGRTLPTWDPFALVTQLEIIEMRELLEHADLRESIHLEFRRMQPDHLQYAGFLGWSIDHKEYRTLVKETVTAFAGKGLAVVTGGSGGYMLVANRAAKEAGAHSIGVPYVGLMRLTNETEIGREWQTMTLPTNSYPVRIATLVENKNWIIVAPGSSGTQQEVATAILQLGATEATRIIFLSHSFYSDVVEWMRQSLPQSMAQRIYLVDSAAEALLLLEAQ